jgi:lipoyl(octanoyl) transferase
MSSSTPRIPVPYDLAAAAQRALAGRRREGAVPDLLWLLEHPPTITWGSSGGRDHLRLDPGDLAARGVAVHASERGGDVTFHEPGQLVGYPIVDIGGPGERDLHLHLRRVEQAIIALLAGLGIAGERVAGRTGVWILEVPTILPGVPTILPGVPTILPGAPPRKIAAIGVKARRWVTSHGFALNVENPLDGFGWIVPCGIEGAAVTSIAREVRGRPMPSWEEVSAGVHRALEAALGRPLLLVAGKEGLDLAAAHGGR